eukprot:s768_g23.t1
MQLHAALPRRLGDSRSRASLSDLFSSWTETGKLADDITYPCLEDMGYIMAECRFVLSHIDEKTWWPKWITAPRDHGMVRKESSDYVYTEQGNWSGRSGWCDCAASCTGQVGRDGRDGTCLGPNLNGRCCPLSFGSLVVSICLQLFQSFALHFPTSLSTVQFSDAQIINRSTLVDNEYLVTLALTHLGTRVAVKTLEGEAFEEDHEDSVAATSVAVTSSGGGPTQAPAFQVARRRLQELKVVEDLLKEEKRLRQLCELKKLQDDLHRLENLKKLQSVKPVEHKIIREPECPRVPDLDKILPAKPKDWDLHESEPVTADQQQPPKRRGRKPKAKDTDPEGSNGKTQKQCSKKRKGSTDVKTTRSNKSSKKRSKKPAASKPSTAAATKPKRRGRKAACKEAEALPSKYEPLELHGDINLDKGVGFDAYALSCAAADAHALASSSSSNAGDKDEQQTSRSKRKQQNDAPKTGGKKDDDHDSTDKPAPKKRVKTPEAKARYSRKSCAYAKVLRSQRKAGVPEEVARKAAAKVTQRDVFCPGYVEPRAAGAFVPGFRPGPPLTSPALPKAPSVDSMDPTSPAPCTPAQASTRPYTPPSSLIRGVSTWSLAAEEKGKGKGGADSVQVISSQETQGHPPMPSEESMREFTDAQIPPCTPPVASPILETPRGESSTPVVSAEVSESLAETKKDTDTCDMSPRTLAKQKTLRLEDTWSEEHNDQVKGLNGEPANDAKKPAEHENTKGARLRELLLKHGSFEQVEVQIVKYRKEEEENKLEGLLASFIDSVGKRLLIKPKAKAKAAGKAKAAPKQRVALKDRQAKKVKHESDNDGNGNDDEDDQMGSDDNDDDEESDEEKPSASSRKPASKKTKRGKEPKVPPKVSTSKGSAGAKSKSRKKN